MNRPIDISPDRSFYRVGDPVRIHVQIDPPTVGLVECRIFHLGDEVTCLSVPVEESVSPQHLDLEWLPPAIAPRGYGVRVDLVDASGRVVHTAHSAFDVLTRWTDHPRYGFVCEFSPERNDVDEVIDELTRFHVNGLQFYDWQYRHDDPLPPSDIFDDPLDRRLSLTTVRALIDQAHERHIASMAYLAVYGSSMELWRARPEWALYDHDGAPIAFDGDFLGLMDPTRGTPWADHLQGRCREVLDALPFDGIHIDQYGEPRTAFNVRGDPVDLPEAFSDFVHDLKAHRPDAVTTFNAVKNWPIVALVSAPMDFVYIELWPETPTYREIGEIVERAYVDSGHKPVVIALYIPADREVNIALVDAIIIMHGGSRIEVGEGNRLLSDPYFPLHEELSGGLYDMLLRYSDFRVRYGEFLGTAGRPSNMCVDVPDSVWAVVRDVPGWSVVNLVNMSGIGDAHWDEEHRAPVPMTDVTIDVHTDAEVRRVWLASPDGDDPQLVPAEWSIDGEQVRITVPSIEFWTMVAVEFEEGKGD